MDAPGCLQGAAGAQGGGGRSRGGHRVGPATEMTGAQKEAGPLLRVSLRTQRAPGREARAEGSAHSVTQVLVTCDPRTLCDNPGLDTMSEPRTQRKHPPCWTQGPTPQVLCGDSGHGTRMATWAPQACPSLGRCPASPLCRPPSGPQGFPAHTSALHQTSSTSPWGEPAPPATTLGPGSPRVSRRPSQSPRAHCAQDSPGRHSLVGAMSHTEPSLRGRMRRALFPPGLHPERTQGPAVPHLTTTQSPERRPPGQRSQEKKRAECCDTSRVLDQAVPEAATPGLQSTTTGYSVLKPRRVGFTAICKLRESLQPSQLAVPLPGMGHPLEPTNSIIKPNPSWWSPETLNERPHPSCTQLWLLHPHILLPPSRGGPPAATPAGHSSTRAEPPCTLHQPQPTPRLGGRPSPHTHVWTGPAACTEAQGAEALSPAQPCSRGLG